MDVVKVWVEDTPEPGTKFAMPNLARAAVGKTIEVAGDALRDGIKTLAAQFSGVLESRPTGEGAVVIDEIELSLTVSANGGVELLGRAMVGVQTGIKLKLKRQA